MESRLVREVGSLAVAVAGGVLAVWLLVTFVVAQEWLRLGLGLGVIVCAALAVWLGRYDPAASAGRRARAAAREASGTIVSEVAEDGRIKMPTLPPRR